MNVLYSSEPGCTAVEHVCISGIISVAEAIACVSNFDCTLLKKYESAINRSMSG